MQQAIVFQEVGYIGKKRIKRDTVFGTRLSFTPGQIHPVPSNIANQMVQHDDVYVLADSDKFKAFLSQLENGNVQSVATGPVIPELTETQKIDEKVKLLEVELSKSVRKEQIREHEVTTKLAVEFDEADKLNQMVEKVVAKYREYLINKSIEGAQ